MSDVGRPEYTDEQFQTWLEDLKPFLKLGNTLNYAIEKADLSKHKTTIYEKFRLGDWFSQKIDTYRSYLGEITNNIFAREILNIEEVQKQGRPISEEQWRNLRFFAEKHRSSSPFFVSRQEIAQTVPNKQETMNELEREFERIDLERQNEQMVEDLKEEMKKREAQKKSIEAMSDEELTKMQEKTEANNVNVAI